MRKKSKSKRRLIGVLEFAEKLNCHPASVPKFIKGKAGFPQPAKLLNKLVWFEDVADDYIASLIEESAV